MILRRILCASFLWKAKAFLLISCLIVCFYVYQYRRSSPISVPLILLYTYNYSIKTRDHICRGGRNGGHVIHFDRCPRKCQFSCRLEDFHRRSPAAVLFFGEDFSWSFQLSDRNRSSLQQRWIFWSWEAPIHHPEYTKASLTFNWFDNRLFDYSSLILSLSRTMTYRQDSDIVHDYGRYILRNQSHTIRDVQVVDFYLSANDNRSTFDINDEFRKRKNEIVWFVSNCRSQTQRHEFAKALNKLYPIDQYGQCSDLNKTSTVASSTVFERTLFQYKFYLAFENAHCQDYITEKAFYNALAHGSIPIVLGSTEENYKDLLPPNSFLHLKHFDQLDQLADELKRINDDRNVFKSYHQWRDNYRLIVWPSNYFIDDRFCDLCIKLYNDKKEKIYSNFSNWLNKCK